MLRANKKREKKAEIETLGLWRVVDEHNHFQRRCGQITLSERALRRLKMDVDEDPPPSPP